MARATLGVLQGNQVFKLQLVGPGGAVAQMPGGGPAERDLIVAIVDAIHRRVGFWKTDAAVRRAVKEGVTEAIQQLKQDSRFAVYGL